MYKGRPDLLHLEADRKAPDRGHGTLRDRALGDRPDVDVMPRPDPAALTRRTQRTVTPSRSFDNMATSPVDALDIETSGADVTHDPEVFADAGHLAVNVNDYPDAISAAR